MKLSGRTHQVLGNFSSINPSIMFKKGDVLSTISPTKTIFAKARLDQSFEDDFAIFDLGRFLNALNLFKEPELEKHDNRIKLFNGEQEVWYTCADPESIVRPPEKEIKIPHSDISFAMPQEMFATVYKAAGVLGLTEISVVGDGNAFYLQAGSSANPTSDKYSVKLGDIDKKFNIIFKKDYLKLIPGNYQVQISSKGISHFGGEFVEYFVPIEASSTFGD